MSLLHNMGILQLFLGLCKVKNEPKNLYFLKSDLNIRFLVQVNLPIQNWYHLTVCLAILCCFYIFWIVLMPFLGVCEITWYLIFLQDKLTDTKSKLIIVQKVFKTKVLLKNTERLHKVPQRRCQKSPQNTSFYFYMQEKLMLYKSTFRNTSVPIWMSFRGISVECFVIVL